MKAARLAGISTATIGKLGPAFIFDHTERSGEQTIVIDDMTGRSGGIVLGKDLQARLVSAGLGIQAPTRGDNGQAGDDGDLALDLGAHVEVNPVLISYLREGRRISVDAAALEALAHGLPVVVSAARYCGIAALLTHELDALILENPRDATALAQALQRLLFDCG